MKSIFTLAALVLAARGFGQTGPSEAELLKGADARIEQYRKADATIRVVDKSGEPVPEAQVKIEQMRHAFLFGCNAFPLLSYPDVRTERTYEREFTGLFNYATLGFYWGAFEPEQGKPQTDKLMAQARWLRDNAIEIKGHPLVWHEVYPKWAPSDADEAKRALERRIHREMTRFAGLIDRWDVVNEAQVAAKYDNGVGHWAKRDGAATMVATALDWAQAANPKATLLYNDYKLDEGYLDLAKSLFDKGAPVSVFGLQSHMHSGEWPLTRVWQVCETFNRLGKPLHFTELTVLSGEHGYERKLPWPTTPEGEVRQADYVEKLYTLLFSHPAVQAITWWDMMDGGWQGAPAGLVRADLTPKPAYDRLVKLVRGKWWTTLDASTAADGRTAFRGFAGHYRVTVTSGVRAGSMEADILQGRTNEITIRLND